MRGNSRDGHFFRDVEDAVPYEFSVILALERSLSKAGSARRTGGESALRLPPQRPGRPSFGAVNTVFEESFAVWGVCSLSLLPIKLRVIGTAKIGASQQGIIELRVDRGALREIGLKHNAGVGEYPLTLQKRLGGLHALH